MRPEELLTPTGSGLCCPAAGFHIDPLRPVDKALITHAHSDHARAGHRHVLATQETLDLMRLRYGDGFAGSTQAIGYGETVRFGEVAVTFHPAGHVLGSAQILVERAGLRIVASGDYKDQPDPTCAPFAPVACDVFITEATFGLPVFRHGDPASEIAKLLRSLALFPERAHLVGVYALGKAQRLIALLRGAGYDKPVYLHGAIETITRYYATRFDLGDVRLVRDAKKGELAGAITLCPPSALNDLWTRRFPDPIACFASGWMRVRARARQRGVELPLVISDHCDWDGLTRVIPATGAAEVWVTHGAEEALVHWCETQGLRARPLHLVGYGEEEKAHEQQPPLPTGERSARTVRFEPGEGGTSIAIPDVGAPSPDLADARPTSPPEGEVAATARIAGTPTFAELLDRLAYEHGRNAKLRLMTEFFRTTPDPERGYALAALTGALSFAHAKPGLIRTLIAERSDPVLFAMSYDYVGDLSETVALLWPVKAPSQPGFNPPPRGLRGRGTAHGAVEGANDVRPESAPSTVLRTVPLPRFTGEDEDERRFLNENADADQTANAARSDPPL
jgi:putative mRNA 3-end processing factor